MARQRRWRWKFSDFLAGCADFTVWALSGVLQVCFGPVSSRWKAWKKIFNSELGSYFITARSGPESGGNRSQRNFHYRNLILIGKSPCNYFS